MKQPQGRTVCEEEAAGPAADLLWENERIRCEAGAAGAGQDAERSSFACVNTMGEASVPRADPLSPFPG